MSAACPRCGGDDARYEGRYGPMGDGAFVCFNCMSNEERGKREYVPPILRVGRKVGRTLYLQVGDEPSDDDPLVGMMDTRELAAYVSSLTTESAPQRTTPESSSGRAVLRPPTPEGDAGE